jgi:hypothetical protein
MSLERFGATRPPAVNRGVLIKQQETTMKNVMSIVAIVLSLVGSANLAMAQSNPDLGVVTSSEANSTANYHDGEYHVDRGE